MLETLLTGSRRVDPTAPLIGFNYDTNRSTGITLITSDHAASQLVTPPVALSGYTKVLNGANRNNSISPFAALNVGTGDFTLVFRGLLVATSGYCTFFNATAQSSVAINVRIGDAGFGNRLSVSVNPNTVATCFSTPQTRDAFSTWRHVAMVRNGGMLRAYFDGAQQNLASGTGSNYLSQQSGANSVGGVSQAAVGGTNQATGLYVAEFAFYGYAKYTENFTVPAGHLV